MLKYSGINVIIRLEYSKHSEKSNKAGLYQLQGSYNEHNEINIKWRDNICQFMILTQLQLMVMKCH